MILTILLYAGFTLQCIIVSILVHELGHLWAYHRITGKKAHASIKFFKIELRAKWKSLTPEQYRAVLWAGIIAGVLYLFLIFGLVPSYMQGLFYPVLAVYTYGSRHDILNIIRSHKEDGTKLLNTTSETSGRAK